jgi:hypothetical protein
MVMGNVMEKFMFARRFKVSDFTQLSDNPWISKHCFIIEADSVKDAWGKANELYGKKYDFLNSTWECRKVNPEELFFQNTWVKFFLKVNRGVSY